MGAQMVRSVKVTDDSDGHSLEIRPYLDAEAGHVWHVEVGGDPYVTTDDLRRFLLLAERMLTEHELDNAETDPICPAVHPSLGRCLEDVHEEGLHRASGQAWATTIDPFASSAPLDVPDFD